MKRISIFSTILALLLFPELNGGRTKKADNLADTNNIKKKVPFNLKKKWQLNILEKGLKKPEFKEFLAAELKEFEKAEERIKAIELIDKLHITISLPKENQRLSKSQVEHDFKECIDLIPREYICIEREAQVEHEGQEWSQEISLVDHCIINHWWPMADHLLSKGAIINLKKFEFLLDEEINQFCEKKREEKGIGIFC